MVIRIGARGSRLAMIQAQQVADRLSQYTNLPTELVPFDTLGDQDRLKPLSKLGGSGVFCRELERGLLDRKIDLAVHSLKDLPLQQPPGLALAAILPREDPHDVLVSHPDWYDPQAGVLPLVEGVTLGTSSPRRAAQAATCRGNIVIKPLRGNVPTRLKRVQDKTIGATILAAAGLNRLGIEPKGLIFHPLPLELFPGAPGQGAIAVEVRSYESCIDVARAALHHPETEYCVQAERALLEKLGGGCSLPLGVLIRQEEGSFFGDAFYALPDGSSSYAHETADTCEALAEKLFLSLLISISEASRCHSRESGNPD